MSTDRSSKPEASRPANKQPNLGLTAAVCVVFVAGMLGMAFAAAPLYSLFCQVTGLGGTIRQATSAPDKTIDRYVTVRFDANVANGLGWSFRPLERSVRVKVGETAQVAFEAENRTDVATTGQAAFNVAPDFAGAYFNKIACFCFTQQTLGPGQKAKMPVIFFVDPSIADDMNMDYVDTITLSYTFFPSKPAEVSVKPVADAATGKKTPL